MASHISISELHTVLEAVKQFILSKFQQVDDRVTELEKNISTSGSVNIEENFVFGKTLYLGSAILEPDGALRLPDATYDEETETITVL